MFVYPPKTNCRKVIIICLATVLLDISCAYATEKVAILNFELNDITSLPRTRNELIRTASIKPLLEKNLGVNADVKVISGNPEDYLKANAGFGYLFRFPDEAAALGKKWGADWIVVGLHSKPSFLESSLIANVVKVSTGREVREIVVDIKGNSILTTDRAVKELANKIRAVLKSIR